MISARESGAGSANGDFLFVGEDLALDLINTEVVVRGQRRDLLAGPVDVSLWWRAARAHYSHSGLAGDHPLLARGDDVLLRALREFRRALRALFEAVIGGRAVGEENLALFNRVLGVVFAQLAVDEENRPRIVQHVRDDGVDGLLAPIARAAAELLSGKDLARLHRCDNERCVLLFYDTTKSATRRWCSTGCMNRARSRRRHRERMAERRQAGPMA